MKIAVMTSGGDAPGMNAAIRAIVRTCKSHDFEIFAIQNGFRGLTYGEFKEMNKFDVSNIIFRGGTILGSSRFMEFEQREYQLKAVSQLKERGIEAVVVIGGDGSFRGAQALSKHGIRCICIPASIDNDISSTDYTIGFDTACNTIVSAIDRVRDTASSHNRCTIVEMMGRDCGDLSIYASIATGCDYIITKETGYDESKFINELITNRKNGKQHAIIGLAENMLDVKELKNLVEEKVGYESRYVVLGHVQRGGSPSSFDRILASRLGNYAVELLRENEQSKIVGYVKGNLISKDIFDTETKGKEKTELYDIFDLLK